VDNGLRRLQGRKVPLEVLDVDLTSLARAVTSVVRRQAVAQVIRVSGVPYVQINGRGINATVPQTDWERLLPLIYDSTFSTQVVPAESAVRELDAVRLSSSTVDARDPLYTRIYAALSRVFINKVPA
jgi:hypothetical protein